jgi:hypothetical protein
MDIVTIIGLSGIALTISSSEPVSDLREWLSGFDVRLNPLRILGSLMSAMVIGFVAGLVFGGFTRDAVVLGGAVSISSAVGDEVLAMMHAIVRRLMPSSRMPMMPPIEVPGRPQKKPLGAPISEDEAHAEMDAKEAEELEVYTS